MAAGARSDTLKNALLWLAFAMVLCHVLSFSWLGDDAFITLRVMDNALRGLGLRWNFDERVQVYTHPLWLLLHIPFYALSGGQPYLSSLLLSGLCTATALALLLRAVPARPLALGVLVLLPFGLSRTMQDYASSGLETPLLLVLVAWFYHTLLNHPGMVQRLLFIAALAMLTRLDALFSVLPALLWLAARHRPTPQGLSRCLLSLSPLLLWHAFSLFYYGFMLPNTKYAKLNTGIPLSEYAWQGLCYVLNLLRYDWMAAAAIYGTLLYVPFTLRGKPATHEAQVARLLVWGVAAQVAYVILIGGDFMAGRFLAVPFLMALLAGLLCLRHIRAYALLVMAAAMPIGVQVQQLDWTYERAWDQSFDHGIIEERQYFYECSGTFNVPDALMRESSSCWLANDGRSFTRDTQGQEHRLNERGALGMFGYYAAWDVIVVDYFGLADPLLARLPMIESKQWRPGHYPRPYPPGFFEARATGDAQRLPPGLREYYEKLRLITAGPLFSAERLKVLAAFQLGYYDHWREAYLHPPPEPAP